MFTLVKGPKTVSTPHRELFVKLLGTEEEDLAEGDGERADQLGETEGGRIAAEEEIQDEIGRASCRER